SRAFDQPGRGDFHFAVDSREIRDLFSVADQVLPSGDRFNARERFGNNDGVFEERSRAAAIGIIGRDQHRFARADCPHRFARQPERRFCRNIREEALEIGIANRRFSARFQRISDGRYDVTVTGRGVENAGAVAELALGVAQFGKPSGEAIKDANRNDRLAHLLPVSADVLNRRAADAARNPAQTFDTCKTALDALSNNLVPILAGLGRNDDLIAFAAPRHAFERHVNDQTGEAFVGDQGVTPAAENEQRKALLFGERKRLEHLIFDARFGEKARGAADPQRGQRRERNILLNQSLIAHWLYVIQEKQVQPRMDTNKHESYFRF